MIAAYCNGEVVDAFALDSRAAHYGDGVFTTLRVNAGRVCWWNLHLARLQAGCEALHLLAPDWSELQTMLELEAAAQADAVIKIMLVPIASGRGYSRDWPSPVDSFVLVYRTPPIEEARYRDGCVLLGSNVAFADCDTVGVKSLSRLAQVNAAPQHSEHEHLLVDRDGFVVSARSANLFAQFGTQLVTPPVGNGVIAGVARARLLQSPPSGFSVRVQSMHRDSLLHADALILSNAVRGYVPVARFGERAFMRRDAIAAIMHAQHPLLGLPES